jgi:hypothetical protein
VEAGDARYDGFGYGVLVAVSLERATELGFAPSAKSAASTQLVMRMPRPQG